MKHYAAVWQLQQRLTFSIHSACWHHAVGIAETSIAAHVCLLAVQRLCMLAWAALYA